jgi:hypothetical protein
MIDSIRRPIRNGGNASSSPAQRRAQRERRGGARLSRCPRIEPLEQRLLLATNLNYSTYWGGSRNESVADVAADSAGNTYVIGTTESSNLGISSGGDTHTERVFLTKFTPDGQPAYTMVLGPAPQWDNAGYVDTNGYQVVVGADDAVFVSYATFETSTAAGLPLPGPHFLRVAKLTAEGELEFDTVAPFLPSPTYLYATDFAEVHLATDSRGFSYLAYSPLIATSNGGFVVDPYISKLAPDGSVLYTNRMLGAVAGLAVDDSANIYVALSTSRDDLPVTAGAIIPQRNGPAGTTDLWIAKLDSTGTAVLAATYFGGTSYDTVEAMTMRPDEPGVVYIAGRTESVDFPVLSPLQRRPTPGSGVGSEFFIDAYIAAINLTASPTQSSMNLIASTYFGGGGGDYLTDIELDSTGGLIVAGSTNSFPIPLADPIQPTLTAGPVFHDLNDPVLAHDLLLARFDSALTALEFSTYFGGSGHDSGARLAVESNGTVHLAATSSGRVFDINNRVVVTSDFPVVNATQPTFRGGAPSFGLERLETDAVLLSISTRGTLAGLPLRAEQGRPINAFVAVFTTPRPDAEPSDFASTIDWGDGTTSVGVIKHPNPSSKRWFVEGLHEYLNPGEYPVIVRVEDQAHPELSPVSNLNVSHWAANQTGGVMATDPTNPNRVFAAMTDEAAALGAEPGLVVAASSNRGATWVPGTVATADDPALPPARKNPDVLFDDFGNLFLAYQGGDGNNIVVAWSTDGGNSFDADHVQSLAIPGSDATGEAISTGSPKLAFGSSSHEIWVTFEDRLNNVILAAAAQVVGLGVVSDFTIHTVRGSTGGTVSDIAAGLDSGVVVMWQASESGGGAKLLAGVGRNTAGLDSFDEPVAITTSSTSGDLSTPAQQSPVPLGATLAWDTSNRSHRRRLYAAFVDLVNDIAVPPGPQEVTLFTAFSDDSGATWSDPRHVTFDVTFQTMFQPSIAVDPVTGAVAVGWYGIRGAPGIGSTNYYVATSNDGLTFSNPQAVTVATSDAFDLDLNEYGHEVGYGEAPGLTFHNGVLHPVWSDNSNLEGTNLFPSQFEVATAIVGVIDVRVPPVAIRPHPIEAIRNQLFSGTVATFTHPDGALRAAHFTATIHWGDGVVTLGTVTQPDGPTTEFIVSGSHTYGQAGAFPLWIEVQDNQNNVHASPVSNITAQQGSQDEPTIAVDPTNPDHVFAASMHVNEFTPLGISVAGSTDGGVTWRSGTIADGNDGLPTALLAQPRAVFDQFGNLFLTYLTAPPERQVVVLLSTDGGLNFNRLATFSDVDPQFQPSIAVGPGEGNGGSVWVAWHRGSPPFQVIMTAGAAVTGLGSVAGFVPRLIAPLSFDSLERSATDVAVGPGGKVLVSYVRIVETGTAMGPAEIIVQLDPDGLGPEPFGPAIVAAPTQVGTKLPIPAQPNRKVTTQGKLVWDRSTGEHAGRVYLVYTDAPDVADSDTNIFIIASDNDGVTWSEPIQVHDDNPGSQFLPSVAIDQNSGNVGVGWYTTVDDDLIAARFSASISDDGGSTFRIARLVSPGDSDATLATLDELGKALQFGSTTGIAFVGGVLEPAWTENSDDLSALPDPRRFDIASARVAVAEVSRTPLVVQPSAISDVEGNEFTIQVATFTDPEGALDASAYKAKIDWGDGSQPSDGAVALQPNGTFSVLGTHEYSKLGRYPVKISIKAPRTHGEGTVTAEIANAPLDIAVAGGLRVVREQQFTKVVGTLTDLNRHSVASDFVTTVEWGDGAASLAVLQIQPGSGQAGQPNTFQISATHRYLSERSFTLNVSLLERDSGQTLARQGELVSGDPPLVVRPGDFLEIVALEGVDTGNLTLVRFSRADGITVPLDTTAGEYTATINWGDGQVDEHVIPFVTSSDVTVAGRHTYATAGEYFPSITLVDDSGGFYSVQLTALVEPDVTHRVSAIGSGLIYNPAIDRFVGELRVTNTSSASIDGPFFAVFRDITPGVTLANIADVTADGNPVVRVSRMRLQPGESLDPIALEFANPSRAPISYRVQVYDGVRSSIPSLVFEPNLGQTDDSVNFVSRGSNYSVYFASSGAVLSLAGGRGTLNTPGPQPPASAEVRPLVPMAALTMRWLNGAQSPAIRGVEPQPDVSNYLVGSDSSDWISGVPHFGRIRYESVYPHIDLEYYGREGKLEFDWIVRPGGNPDDIVMAFAGTDAITIDSAGNLRLHVGEGELTQRAPVLYQDVAGIRREVAGRYAVAANGSVHVRVDGYDPTRTLVIDPVLIYSTYFGDFEPSGDIRSIALDIATGGGSYVISQSSAGEGIAMDAMGNTYVTGTTTPFDFPTSAGAFQDESIDEGHVLDLYRRRYARWDAFVIKLDPNGVPIYSTYLGGNLDDYGIAIAVNDAGEVYVTGATQSTNFPTLAAFQTQHSDQNEVGQPSTFDGFLTKLDATGSHIEYSTYFGGRGEDLPAALAIDRDGHAIVVGKTESPSFPTHNAIQPEHARDFIDFRLVTDAFITKFDTSGSSLVYSTYLGGRGGPSFFGSIGGYDEAIGVVVDSAGNAVVVGNTTSSDLPTHNALFDEYHLDQTAFNECLVTIGGISTAACAWNDVFVAKLPADGSVLDVLTYLGGTHVDDAAAVARDAAGNLYIAGQTRSRDLPLVRPIQDSLKGAFDGFIVELNPALSSILYGTYLGGRDDESSARFRYDTIRAIGVDGSGNIVVAGETSSADLPVTAALQDELAGETDLFLASINPSSSSFNYLSYMGGTGLDYVNGLAADRAGNVVLAGSTMSFDFPTYRGHSNIHSSQGIASRTVIAKIAAEPPPGFNRLELVHRTIAAVEGAIPFDGLVASVVTAGSETADDFSATIDWGDGTVSPGTIAPGAASGVLGRRQFNVFGSHLYRDVGNYDVSVTVRDAAGHQASAQATEPADGVEHVRYQVALDTSSLHGQSGYLSLQFNPGSAAGVSRASLATSEFVAPGTVLGATVLRDGESTGDFSTGVSLGSSSLLNRLSQQLVFGDRIEFFVEISGDAVAHPAPGAFGSMFAVQLLAADRTTPLLTTSRSGAALTIAVDPDGATKSRAILPNAAAADSVAFATSLNVASIANAPLDAQLSPFSVQEGTEFAGTVATFTNGNPFETTGFQASIDWGDGSPPVAGVIVAGSGRFTVTAAHTYRRAGDYPFRVIVTEPDGASVTGRNPLTGNHIEASRTAALGGLFAPVVADFNADGKLDVAAGPGSNKLFVSFGRGDFTFDPPREFVIATAVDAAAAGDFDGDGIVDLVVAGRATQTGTEALTVLFGSRDGNLRPASATAPLAGFVVSLAAADFDSDGHLDVVVGYGCCFSRIDVLRGHGDGTFEAWVTRPGFLHNLVAAGDLNGDGRPEIAVAGLFSSSLLVLPGLPGGSLGDAQSVPLPDVAHSLTIADVGGDGRLDVVAGTGDLVVVTMAGAGTFTSRSHRATNALYRVGLADWNNDGRLDVAASDEASTITLLRATAGGGFATTQVFTGPQAMDMLVGDLDGDGAFDLANTASVDTYSLRIYPGRGDGTVEVAETVPNEVPLALDVLVNDFDRDGLLDIASMGAPGLRVTRGRGDGTFDIAPQFPLGNPAVNPSPTGVALSDFNGDGRTDIVAGVADGLAILTRNEVGSYLRPVTIVLTGRPFDVAAVDINGDGRPDIVASIPGSDFTPGNLVLLLNRGDGTFGNPRYLEARQFARSLLVRDLDGDGAVDIAVQVSGAFDSSTFDYPDGGVEIFRGVGDGTFSPRVLVPAGASPSMGVSGALAAGDVNGDSITDLVVAAAGIALSNPSAPNDPPVMKQDGVYILLGNGDGTYRNGERYRYDSFPNGPASVTLGDFNRDGKLDAAMTRSFIATDRTDDLLVLLGNGDGTFGVPASYDLAWGAGQVVSGDLNGDGILDLAAAQASITRSGIYVLLGRADGTFSPARIYLSGSGPLHVAIGDVDRDGRLDAVSTNSDPFNIGTVGILYGRGDGTLVGALASQGLGFHWLISGDVNRDGVPDIIGADGMDNVGVYVGRGNGTFESRPVVQIPPPPNTGWSHSGPRDMAIVDLDGDGNLELLVALSGSAGNLVVLPIDANGSLGPPDFRSGPAVGLGRFVFADMNGDGKLDVVRMGVPNTTFELTVLLARADGTFLTLPALPAGASPRDLIAADLNGDGKIDVAIANNGTRSSGGASTSNGGVRVFLGVGDGTLQPPTDYESDQPIGAIAADDLNGDQMLDLVLGRVDPSTTAERSIDVLYNRGDGTFGSAQRFDANSDRPSAGWGIATGDFSRDGLPDIVIAGHTSFDPGVQVIRNVPLPVDARVLDAPLAAFATDLHASAGVAFTTIVGSFSDTNPFSVPGDFAATIDWGDGESSPGTIVQTSPGQFQVGGTHRYRVAGEYVTTISLQEIGASRRSASARAAVSEFVDTTPPHLTVPTDITVPATGLDGAVASFNVTAADDVDGELAVDCSPAPGTRFPVGSTLVTCSATDGAGNTGTSSFRVIVLDASAPVLTVPSDITIEAAGPSGAVATYTASAADAFGNPLSVNCSPPSGHTFALGTFRVTCTAADSAQHSVSADFRVIVQDTRPPMLAVPSDITVEATGSNGAAVTFTATATDIVDGPIVPQCSRTSGGTFDVGTTTVTCSARDAAGNQAAAQFHVTVHEASGEASPLWGVDEDDGELFSIANYTQISHGAAAAAGFTSYGRLMYDRNGRGAYRPVGPDIEAMTIDSDGMMYMAVNHNLVRSGKSTLKSPVLIKFDVNHATTTGPNVVEVVGRIPIAKWRRDDNISGLTIQPGSGDLYALFRTDDDGDDTDRLLKISKANARVLQNIGEIRSTSLNRNCNKCEDLKFDESGDLYASDDWDDHLYRVNPASGEILATVDSNERRGLTRLAASLKIESIARDPESSRFVAFDDNSNQFVQLTMSDGNNASIGGLPGLTDVEGLEFHRPSGSPAPPAAESPANDQPPHTAKPCHHTKKHGREAPKSGHGVHDEAIRQILSRKAHLATDWTRPTE